MTEQNNDSSFDENTTETPPESSDQASAKPKKRSMLRRTFFLLLAGGILGYYYFRPFKPERYRTKKRIVLLGFDGADPQWVEQWWDELPNLRRLRERGTWSYLESSIPPESPVAWSCFAVGANPGQHGVYDFLRRPVGSYQPTVESFVGREYAEFLFGEIPYKMPKAKMLRRGTAFWDVLSKQGVDTTMIEVPVTFPAPKLSHGRVLSGLGVPDVRGVQATFHHFLYDPAEKEQAASDSTFGGKIVALTKKANGVYEGEIWGPYDPVADQKKRELERERMAARLAWCEWQAHLITFQGDFADEESQQVLRNYFANFVLQPFSLHDYLQTEDFAQRIKAIQHYLRTGQDFVKETDDSGKPVVGSVARQEKYEADEKIQNLKSKILKQVKPIKTPVTFKPIDAETIEIQTNGQTQQVKKHEWSDWFTLTFPVTSLISVQAICRFYLESSQPTIDVFMTSPDIDPRNPAIAVSHPSDYSKQLAEWIGGPFKTRGWAAETHGLKDGHLSEKGFMKDLLYLMDLREKKTFETLKRSDSNVFISVFSETDRVGHMFTHLNDQGHPMYDPQMAEEYADSIKTIYKRMDEIVGRMMREIGDDPDSLLIVMSDHGFSTWRYQVNINTWLVKNGFMALKGNNLQSDDKKLADLANNPNAQYFQYVDWSQTKAYALGLGQIYINKQHREPMGIVTDDEYERVCNDICRKLEALTDAREGRRGDINPDGRVVEFARKRSEIWHGPYANDEHDCPDIQVGFKRGYRVSWQTCLGGIAPEVIADNMEKWGGDHCSLSNQVVPGMFFCSRKLNNPNPAIYDIAPTVLRYFNVDTPPGMEGKDLLQT